MHERNFTKQRYEKSNSQKGFKAQQLYPNEELLRFFFDRL